MANEYFSGKGHGRHICRECSKLDGSEKEYRQVLANLDRSCRHTYPFVHKSRRKWFDSLATSPNEQVRKLHAEVTAQIAAEREKVRRLREQDEQSMEEAVARLEGRSADDGTNPHDKSSEIEDDEIPF